MRWLWTRIQARIETAALLDVEIEEARETLAQLETDTWGIVLREVEGERFVVLPAGALDDPPWTVRGQPPVKLSRESASCMTELERQLTAALKRLSEQYEMEQRRRSEQVEALHRQVERLSGQVTRLAQDYRTLAARLPGRWR